MAQVGSDNTVCSSLSELKEYGFFREEDFKESVDSTEYISGMYGSTPMAEKL